MSDKMIEELRLWRKFLPKSITKWEAFEVAKFDEIMSRHEATEPKDCGFTLATCPYERCSGLTMRNPRATEPLEELAKRKGAKLLEISWDSEGWHIYAQWPTIEDGDGVIPSESWSDPKRVNCEASARKFLEGLEDKGGTIC